MRLIVAVLGGGLALAACSPAEPPVPPAPEAPAASAPGAAPAPPPAPPPIAAPDDACGAVERQAWVGQPRSALPATPDGADSRVFETGDVLIQDLRPDRLNVEIDPATQTVVRVACF